MGCGGRDVRSAMLGAESGKRNIESGMLGEECGEQDVWSRTGDMGCVM